MKTDKHIILFLALVKLFLALAFVYLGSGQAFAQKADEIAKNEVIRILQNYENALNAIGDTSKNNEERNPLMKIFRKDFEAKDIFVFNDLPRNVETLHEGEVSRPRLHATSLHSDTASKSSDHLTIFQYIKKLPGLYSNGFKIILDRKMVRIGRIQKNKERNTYTIIVNVIKTVETSTIIIHQQDSLPVDSILLQVESPGIKDSLAHLTNNYYNEYRDSAALKAASVLLTSGDSAETKSLNLQSSAEQSRSITISPIIYDTVVNKSSYSLNFFIKLDMAEQVPGNFKVYAISKAGDDPMLKPLPEVVSWWVSLDDPWRKVFSERLKLPEFPTEYELNNIYSLRELNCSGVEITTLEPIRRLKQLRKLNCSGTSVSSLEPISELENLIDLKINNNKLTTLEPIKNLINLKKLECSKQEISSLMPLKNLVNLIELDCSDNALQDIEPLRNLDSLERLDLSLNEDIISIKPVSNLNKLVELHIRKSNIKSLEPVRNLTRLIELDCFNTEISSLEPLRKLSKLALLNCSYTKIISLEPISKLRYIAYLYVAGNSIDNISMLKNFAFLKELDISKTSVSTLNPVQGNKVIEVLKCFYTNISKEDVQRFRKKHPKCAITYYY